MPQTPIVSDTPCFVGSPSPTRGASPPASTRPRGGIVVFSGGSAANNLVDVFEQLRSQNQCTLSYVIPISDNGGSSSEIIRVFGGPGKKVQIIDKHDTDTTI